MASNVTDIRRFAFLTDLHYGYESKSGHRKPLHDQRAIDVALAFLSDFKPHDVILGGDVLDCGLISHHTKNQPRKREGARLKKEAEECVERFIKPLNSIIPVTGQRVFIHGNHEDWIEDFLDEHPTLEDTIPSARDLLQLDGKWTVVEQGRGYRYHKLHFMHGDTVRGGEHCAKSAVVDYERNVRFGHFHTYQTYTKVSPIDHKLPRTGIAVPCLCTKDVSYGDRKPNKWVQGFLYGYVSSDGLFSDTVAVIINGTLIANGKRYRA